MNKKGQIQLSFGMIFSIIIIIATVAVAFYVISVFLRTKTCIDAGFFYDGLDKEVSDAWKASIVSSSFSTNVPSGVKAVCFGNLTKEEGLPSTDDSNKRDELRKSLSAIRSGANVYLYPIYEGCEGRFPYYNVAHVNVNKFFCVNNVNGKITINLKKEVFDSLVTLSK